MRLGMARRGNPQQDLAGFACESSQMNLLGDGFRVWVHTGDSPELETAPATGLPSEQCHVVPSRGVGCRTPGRSAAASAVASVFRLLISPGSLSVDKASSSHDSNLTVGALRAPHRSAAASVR